MDDSNDEQGPNNGNIESIAARGKVVVLGNKKKLKLGSNI
jgi:hypothetical protein